MGAVLRVGVAGTDGVTGPQPRLEHHVGKLIAPFGGEDIGALALVGPVAELVSAPDHAVNRAGPELGDGQQVRAYRVQGQTAVAQQLVAIQQRGRLARRGGAVVDRRHGVAVVAVIDIEQPGLGVGNQRPPLGGERGVGQVDVADFILRVDVEPTLGRVRGVQAGIVGRIVVGQ